MTATRQPRAQTSSVGPVERGPVTTVVLFVFGGVLTTIFSWALGAVLSYAGMQFDALWADKGLDHPKGLVEENLRYVAEYPRSVIIKDTVAFEKSVIRFVARPFVFVGIPRYYERAIQPLPKNPDDLDRTTGILRRELATFLMTSMYIAIDTAMRLFVIVFALPAFVLACLLGVVDGLVRRDLRRWGGGRESSFVYHRAKNWTKYSAFGGFGFYLAWPFGGFNPAYMVLVFTVMTACALSLYVSTFKKYL